MIEIQGYAPDLNPKTPGIFTVADNIIPTISGFAAAPTPASIGHDALAAACYGAKSLRQLDGTIRTFAGTLTKLYEDGGTTWTDRTRASGGDYGATSANWWSFCQFGDATVAAVKTDTLQYSTTGAFANISGAPKAAIVETVNDFVLAFNTNDVTYGDDVDRWWCAGIGTYDDWTPDIATQCATGRLTSVPGDIKAAKRFGDNIIVYKLRGMYIGTYVGPPTIWQFNEIPAPDIGTFGVESVTNIGTESQPLHLFVGYDDIYIFDGSRPIPIGEPVKRKMFNEIDRGNAHRVQCLHDSVEGTVRIFYPTSGTGNPDKCLVYNYKTQKWGVDNREVEVAFELFGTAVTYDGLSSYGWTYDTIPETTYDNLVVTASTPRMGVIDSSHVLKTLTGTPTGLSFTTWEMGDHMGHTLIQRMWLSFKTYPTSGESRNYYRNYTGDAWNTGKLATLNKGRFDHLREAKWHRFSVTLNGTCVMDGIMPELKVTAKE